ncbi:MAG: PqqD family peptide modification chaperone [Chloroflexota bacterium]|nr:PqqD family peptide modification chaperone [Chloroflexota bacterium]
MIALDSQIVVSNQQISADMPEEMVILSLKDGVYYGLDAVGSFIWQHIQSPQSVSTVIEALVQEYDVTMDEARGDTLQLLSHLQTMGLVEVVA